MVRDLLAALDHAPLRHVALVTGLKHYLGPFEAYAAGVVPDTPFHEEEPRLDTPNFYYAQEDELFAAAARQGFTWSVHRSHTVIGHAVGNAMNMGLTIAVAATLADELDLPFRFPGSEAQWNGLTDMTDAGLLAEQMVWASTDPAGADEPFNIVNGDVFRWRWMWPRLAAYLGVDPARVEGPEGEPQPFEAQLTEHEGGVAGHRRAVRAGRGRHQPARVVVAHRRRPRPADGGRHRHEQEPRGRVPRLPPDGALVHRPVRPLPRRPADPRGAS